MQSQTPEQEKDRDLIAKGNALYGRQSFSRMYNAFSELKPFMTDAARCLEALVNQQPMSGTRRR